MNKKQFNTKRMVVIIFTAAVLVGGLMVAYSLSSGKSLGIKDKFASVVNIFRSVIGHSSVVAMNQGKYTNVIFIHHSVGQNIIEQGKLRDRVTERGFSFWDQDYSYFGLTGPDGKSQGYSYDIPDDNTDIDGYVHIFQQPVYGLPVNAISALLQHEVIVFKSCFPNSNIQDDASLDLRKQEYLSIRRQIDQHPDRVFILLTSPPLNPAETDANSAKRARLLSTWLESNEFTSGHPNLFVYNLFNFLAESNPSSPDFNMLQKGYRVDSDSHPNELANQKVAPILADFIKASVNQYINQTGKSQP